MSAHTNTELHAHHGERVRMRIILSSQCEHVYEARWRVCLCFACVCVCVCVGQIGTINAWEIPSVCVYVWMTVLFKYIAVRHLKFSSVNFAEILQHSIIYCCHFSDCRTLGRSVFQHLFVRMTWIMYMAKSNSWAYADYNGNWWSSKCTYHKYISRMMSVPQHT